MFYSPIKLAFGGIIAWIVIWFLMPIDVVGYLAPGALTYVALCYLGLFLGVMIARQRRPDAHRELPPRRWDLPLDKRLFFFTAGLGLFGMGLRLYDRLILRGVEYGGGALEAREVLSQASVTPVGAVGSVFFAFCFIPLMIVLTSREARDWKLMLFAIAVFAAPVVETLFMLARSFLVLTLGLAFAAVVITRYGGKPFNRKLMAFSILGLAGLAVLSTSIFATRLEAGGVYLGDSIFDSVYAELLQPDADSREVLNAGSDTQVMVYSAILPNGMYYLSGAYEMSLLWDRSDPQPWGYGQLHFMPFVRAALMLVGDTGTMQNFDYVHYLYREGVWQTFFGPLWADFGWFGLLPMIFIGFVTQELATNVKRGSIAQLPIYCYMVIVIFFMPVVNFFMNGLGMFSITSFVLFIFIANKFKSMALVGPEVGFAR